MRVDLFDFELPQDLIAQRPASPRDSARLLDVASDGLHDRLVRDLPHLLRRGDLLVFNDTRVIPARLIGVRLANRGRQDVAVEALLIRDFGLGRWLAFARPAKRLRPGGLAPRSTPRTRTARSCSPSTRRAPPSWPPSNGAAPCRCRPTYAAVWP